jgi:UDP-2-acetamido-2-deoxy-ribo-hexuluronate aminotransferase
MKQIPMLDLKLEYEYMKADIDSAIKRCLDHQKWILGPEVKELEDKIAAYLGVKHCVGTCSGTEALVLSLRALAIKLKGQEFFDKTDAIITTPFTFTATGDAILRAGATPVFVDIDPVTFNIDTNKIREYLAARQPSPVTSNIVGILPVHLYGLSCDMDEIMKIAAEHGLFVVEDVAQAFGGAWKGRKLGSIGVTGAFSFFPSKNLGGFGDGGMIATNDERLAELLRMLLRHGGKDKYNVDHIGYNARIDTLQAAVVLAKFKYLDEFNERRRNIAGVYNDQLKDIEKLRRPGTLPDAYHVYHQYTVYSDNRDKLHQHLKDNGVSSMVYYPFPLHKMKVFDSGRCVIAGNLEHAENACRGVLSLPMEPLQVMNDTSYVAERVKSLITIRNFVNNV